MSIRKGPWTVETTKNIYQNPWIHVQEDQVVRPDGKQGIFGVVTMVPGVSVIPLDNENNVYLTEEYHYGVDRVTIEAVSGAVESDEDPLSAAKRELKEETGLIANTYTDLGSIDPFTTVVVSPNQLYLAEDLTQTQAEPEGTEQITVLKVPLDEAIEWAMNSRITHGATVAALLKIAQSKDRKDQL